MKFEDLDIRPYYNSKHTDVFNEFFNVVLSNSSYYRRFGGIFSTKQFVLIAEGLQNFIKENNGTMDLVIIPAFSNNDKEALLNGISLDNIIAKNWIRDLSNIKEKILEDHSKAISWMIANKYLTVKILIPEHDGGIPFTEDELKVLSIFRQEIGIFYNRDDQNQVLSFHGTIDRDNPEIGELYHLDVSRDWIDTERTKLESDHSDFNSYWQEDSCQIGSVSCRIIPLSLELKNHFKDNSPKTKDEIPDLKKLPVLRNYQVEAIDNWINRDGRGIFEMATGTGKTFTAIGGIRRIYGKNEALLVIIAVPYKSLIDQWIGELEKWFINAVALEPNGWSQVLRDEVVRMGRPGRGELSVLVTTHDLFAKEQFVKQINHCKIPTMLLVDEAHHVGAFASRRGLSNSYSYRMALSATISRYFDDDGTDFLKQYFNGSTKASPIIEYGMEQAIKDGRLCGYNYHPLFVDLNSDELDDYRALTHRAAMLLNSKNLDDRRRGELIIQQRAKIVRDARNKINAFEQILGKMGKPKHLLIFCSENQFGAIEKILRNAEKHTNIPKPLKFRRITYDNPSDKRIRVKILNDFADEKWDILLSNRILDEGVDIPQAKNCIVMASTGNPAQFIQRRGRVLRPYAEPYKDGSKKTQADIFDVLVKPQLDSLNDLNSKRLEIGIIQSQLSKIRQMSKLAMNKDECMEKIKEFCSDLPEE